MFKEYNVYDGNRKIGSVFADDPEKAKKEAGKFFGKKIFVEEVKKIWEV